MEKPKIRVKTLNELEKLGLHGIVVASGKIQLLNNTLGATTPNLLSVFP